MARTWNAAWTPQPITPRDREPGFARYFTATAVAPAVRNAVRVPDPITASGNPVSASASVTTPWMVGRPRAPGFSGKLPFTFAAKYRPSRPALMWKPPEVTGRLSTPG